MNYAEQMAQNDPDTNAFIQEFLSNTEFSKKHRSGLDDQFRGGGGAAWGGGGPHVSIPGSFDPDEYLHGGGGAGGGKQGGGAGGGRREYPRNPYDQRATNPSFEQLHGGGGGGHRGVDRGRGGPFIPGAAVGRNFQLDNNGLIVEGWPYPRYTAPQEKAAALPYMGENSLAEAERKQHQWAAYMENARREGMMRREVPLVGQEHRVAQPIQQQQVLESAVAVAKEGVVQEQEKEKDSVDKSNEKKIQILDQNPPPAQRIIKEDRKPYKDESAAQKPFLEKLTAEASSNTNFIYKVLLLVFAILTAIAAGGWAITSNSKRKSLRRSALAWAWGTALALFLCLVFLCLIIAFPNKNAVTGTAEGAIAENAQVILPGPGPENDQNTSAQFKPPTFVVEDKKSKGRNDWTAIQKQLGMNLKEMEGPRANYRSHPELVQSYPEPLVPLNQVDVNKEDYEEYMRSLQGYNRPEEIQRYAYMPNAAQFPYEPHLDDAEVQHGIEGEPVSYLRKSPMPNRKSMYGDPDVNDHLDGQKAPVPYQIPTTVHPWLQEYLEQKEGVDNAPDVAKVFQTDTSEHKAIIGEDEYRDLIDKSAAEFAEELERERAQQDNMWFSKDRNLVPPRSGDGVENQRPSPDALRAHQEINPRGEKGGG